MRNQNKLLTNEVVQRYIEMINAGVAKYIKRTGNNTLYGVFDDWAQDCWMEILEYIEKANELPEDWRVWRIIHDKLVDNTRKGELRNTLDYSEEENQGGSWSIDDLATLKAEDTTIINSLLNKFEPGTLERKYIEWYLEKLNIKDFGYHPPTYAKAWDDGYSDSYLATKVLGFSGTGAYGYKKLKSKMQDILRQELDYYEETDSE